MVSSHRLVIKDAVWQLLWRIISALFGFITIKIMTPYLGPMRYGDYSTILKYFAIRTALADLGLYVLALKSLGKIKEEEKDPEHPQLKKEYGKYVGTRIIIMSFIYVVALIIAYLLPVYTSNPYLVWWIPLGMIFSASFMFAGIQQLPLQLFRKMEQLSITLITARLSQILILVPVVYIFFKHMPFDGSSISILAFCLILFSVVASGIGQNIEIYWRANRILPLRIIFDWSFTKEIVLRNWQYGVSYFLSSFHTLIVLLFLWRFLPTSVGNDSAWIWALSLSLIEILLIIPSALGNSLLHKISSYTLAEKRLSLGNLLVLMYRIGGVIALNFWIFAEWIIRVVSGKAFLGSFTHINLWWSDQILPFLWIVLWWSFIKQVYNYLFVAVEKQNILLPINLIWVIIGISLWIWSIPHYGLAGGVITQMTIELVFMVWAIFIARRKRIYPFFGLSSVFRLSLILCVFAVIGLILRYFVSLNYLSFFAVAIVFNGLLVLTSLPAIKKVAKGLTVEDTPLIDV